MIGCRATDLLGHVCHSLICPVVFGKCIITDIRQEIDRSERSVLSRDGRRLPILKTVRKIEFDNRLHSLETFMDITELREKERLQGVLEMAGAATHHLGQPRQVVTASTALLTKTRNQETVAQINEKIGRAIDQIKTIIANIQNITQYQTEAYINGRRIVDIARSSSRTKGARRKIRTIQTNRKKENDCARHHPKTHRGNRQLHPTR